MSDESIGDLMELREIGEGRRFYLLGSQSGFNEVRCTFSTERLDPWLFHLEMKEQARGAVDCCWPRTTRSIARSR